MSFFRNKKKDEKGSIRRRRALSYIIDWIVIPIIGFPILAIHLLPPTQTQFSLNDSRLYFKYHQQQIFPIWLAVVACAGVPMLATSVFCICGIGNTAVGRMGWRSKLKDLHHTWLGLAYAAFAAGVCSLLAVISGKPRPDFMERCRADPAAYRDDSIMLLGAGVVDTTICLTTDTKLLKDGFTSFPSGHAITGFAGLGYLSYFLALRLHVLKTVPQHTDSSKRPSVPLIRIIFSILPLILAIFEAVSRVLDNRHHPFDVIVGSLLGLLCAWIGCYFVLIPNSRADEDSDTTETIPLRRDLSSDTHYPEGIPLTAVSVV